MSALAVGFVAAGFVYRKLKISLSSITILLLPAIWILAEFGRSLFFSVFFIGPGGSVGPYWNFGSLGLVVSSTWLGYASRLVGLYGLSFLVILSALAVFQVLCKKYSYGLLLLIPLTLSIGGYALYNQPVGKKLQVHAVGLGPDMEQGYETKLKNQLNSLDNADLTVLPEYSYYFADSDGQPTGRSLPSETGMVIDSRSGTAQQGHRNITTFYQANGNILAEETKKFLIPGGEYVPYIYQAVLVASGNTDILHAVENDHGVKVGAKKEQPFLYNNVDYGALACSGAIAPNLYAGLSAQGATVLVNSASLSTMGISDLYYRQASQMASFIAVSNARPFVQAARGGPSYILNKDGRTEQILKSPKDVAFITASVATNQQKTIYTKYGEFVLALSVGLVLARSAKLLLKSNRTPKKLTTKKRT